MRVEEGSLGDDTACEYGINGPHGDLNVDQNWKELLI